MRIAIIGAGNMGRELAFNLQDSGHNVYIYNRTISKLSVFSNSKNIFTRESYEDLLNSFPSPKIIWVMVYHEAMDEVINKIKPYLESGDIIIDGTNSHYKKTIERAKSLKRRGVGYIDVGLGGGIEGARKGACLMVGGEKEFVKKVESIFVEASHEGGYSHLGSSGSGHYAKMVHNAIEYGMMQSIAEGFLILNNSDFEFDKSTVASIWANQSTINGKLMSLCSEILTQKKEFEDILGIVDTSGEASWTLNEAIEKKLNIPAITMSVFTRFKSQDQENYSEKLLALLRNSFGAHTVYKRENK